ncbi:hypothetical protein COCNU_12G008490 [Cocos nucifera]|uniref:Uncharacterized protein n=1 Tax=Cocos nucifera TaxID=13894 RepID=A0A8K0IS96_COCNU|nr:hypothetical protein COCNU_12G008490 [Cocos nucifera]
MAARRDKGDSGSFRTLGCWLVKNQISPTISTELQINPDEVGWLATSSMVMESNLTNHQEIVMVNDRLKMAWRRQRNERPVWITMESTLVVIEELMRRFPKVIQLLMKEVWADTKAWMAIAVVAKSLGRRVGVEAAIREFQS